MRRGGHAHSSRGAPRCRAPRPLVGCTEQHPLDGPDGAGLAVEARVTANPGPQHRNPGARERRSAAAVEPPAGGAYHDARGQAARGVPLRAGNPPAGLPPSSTARHTRPARPVSDSHCTGDPPRRGRFRIGRSPSRPRARGPYPSPGLRRASTGAFAEPLAAVSRGPFTLPNGPERHRTVGRFLQVDPPADKPSAFV